MNTPRQKNISIDKDLLGQVEALCAVLHTNFSSKTKEPIGGVENQRTQPIEREGPRVVRAVLRVSAHEKGARRLLGVAYFFVGGEMPRFFEGGVQKRNTGREGLGLRAPFFNNLIE